MTSIVGGVVIFLALGGRFRSLSPSHLAAIGAFGRRHASLTAGLAYATKAERQAIAAFGSKVGCHTCGTRSATFVADHQPPLKLKPRSLRFFPQCVKCSNLQAQVLRGVVPRWRDKVRTHYTKLRPYHATGFCLPPLRDVADAIHFALFGGDDLCLSDPPTLTSTTTIL